VGDFNDNLKGNEMNNGVLNTVLISQEINVDELSQHINDERTQSNSKRDIWVGELLRMIINVLHVGH